MIEFDTDDFDIDPIETPIETVTVNVGGEGL